MKGALHLNEELPMVMAESDDEAIRKIQQISMETDQPILCVFNDKLEVILVG